MEPRIDEQVRRMLLDDERAVHHAGHPEVRVRCVEARLPCLGNGRARAQESGGTRHEDDEGAEPRHAVPSWRRPSKSTTATAVARFRLRTCGLASGIAYRESACALRIASGRPLLSPPNTSRSLER